MRNVAKSSANALRHDFFLSLHQPVCLHALFVWALGFAERSGTAVVLARCERYNQYIRHPSSNFLFQHETHPCATVAMSLTILPLMAQAYLAPLRGSTTPLQFTTSTLAHLFEPSTPRQSTFRGHHVSCSCTFSPPFPQLLAVALTLAARLSKPPCFIAYAE